MHDRAHVLEGDRWTAVELSAADAPALQAFFDANPLYSEFAYGRPWLPDAAVKELAELPPAEWAPGPSHHWAVLERSTGRWLAMTAFTEDVIAPHVWYLKWLLVATAEHGSGLAHDVHTRWLEWARRHGARWVRLGVIATNERAVAFWEREGYVETRQRHGVAYESRTHTMSVRVKALDAGTLEEYFRLVERDRPEAP